jgi:two-component system cell cycle response regulator
MSETAASPLPRVLIVDDSRMVRATIIKHIKGRFDVREEGGRGGGLADLMLDPGIQVLISDLSMPKLDGYGLLQRVRESKIGRMREMPVIMISGDEDESARIAPRNWAPQTSSPRASAPRNCWPASTPWSSWRRRATN